MESTNGDENAREKEMKRGDGERRGSPGPAAKESTNADKMSTEVKNRTLRVWTKNTKFGLSRHSSVRFYHFVPWFRIVVHRTV